MHSIGAQVTINEDDRITSGWESDRSRGVVSDATDCVNRAAHWASVTRAVTDATSGTDEAPVLFTSSGFASLFSMVVPSALLGERIARKESLWADRFGQEVIAPHLDLVDDRTMPHGFSSSGLDAEGVATRRRHLVRHGRMEGIMWSTRDAAKAVDQGAFEHAESTGSANRGSQQAPPSPGAGDLILTSSERTQDREGLIAEIDEGYLVNSVMGAHTANPSSGDFSVTTSQILHISGGSITGALTQAGLTGNVAEALNGRVILGDITRPRGSYSSGTIHLPDLLLGAGIRVNPA